MNKWHDYFMTVAEDSAKLSKDPKTKVGAVLVNNKKIKSIGYNGAPRNFPDDLVPTDSESEHLVNQKNTYMCHAELNAVLNYDNKISDLTGATLYVTISPLSILTVLALLLSYDKLDLSSTEISVPFSFPTP